ncbi:MAG: SIS domain-containing protein [Luteitalea sp.]|nr:SIS domain-containing protein [Luteitalea sp.]
MPQTRATASALVEEALREAAALHVRSCGAVAGELAAAGEAIIQALAAGHKVLACGNGGSAAEAQHVVAELAGRFSRDRAALPAVALTTDTSILTAVANDLGFERVFERQVESLGRPGDVLLALSTSGASANVLRAVNAANSRGLVTIALTGADGGSIGRAARLHVHVAHPVTARVQEVHLTLLHALCELVEREADTIAAENR